MGASVEDRASRANGEREAQPSVAAVQPAGEAGVPSVGRVAWRWGEAVRLRTGDREARADRAIYLVLAAILFLAVLAKTFFLPPAVRLGWFQWPGLLAGAVLMETTAAAWLVLLSGYWPRLTRTLATAMFGGFAVYSLWALARGESCQCFGDLSVGGHGISPAWTLALDVGAVVALARHGLTGFVERTASQGDGLRTGLAAAAATTVAVATCVGLPLALLAAGGRGAALVPGGRQLADSNFVILEPDEWVGKPFPLLPETSIPEDLRQGNWWVVLYRPDCPHCQDVLPELVERFGHPSTGAWRLALVNISNDAGDGLLERAVAGAGQVAWGQLSTNKEWFVTPPVALQLQVGVVQRVLDHEQVSGIASADGSDGLRL